MYRLSINGYPIQIPLDVEKPALGPERLQMCNLKDTVNIETI
jgi:hypothetical protein